MAAGSDSPETDHFKKLMALVDKLRDIGLSEHISMPRIAVLGSQSSGKSSLLESIVGMNFLPRGSGVVTRRPLELRLFRTRDATEPPYGLFAKEPDVKITDFNAIRRKIEQFTEEICGREKNIVDDPIVLRVYSANCPDLTVIDLPGITRIPIGNQPKDIERITKQLVGRYCRDERTIILCVIPANADMSTSEALQLAQSLDPQGIRTVGVITKIDIMDRGTDAKKMLLNKEIPLKLGYIGVKGRSQLDIDNSVGVGDALREEAAFFASHHVYRHLPREILGTEALVRKLTGVMYEHIRRVLPTILNEIEQKVVACERNIAGLGAPIPEDSKEKLDQLWRQISLFYDNFRSQLRGDYAGKTSQESQVLASAQIQLLFNTLYKKFMSNPRHSDHYSDADITKIVNMYSGNSLPGFVSVDCFVALLSPLVEELRAPALELLDKIYAILKATGVGLVNDSFSRMFAVREALLGLFNSVLLRCKESTADFINKYIDCESKVIFTKDPSYIINSTSWPEEIASTSPPVDEPEFLSTPEGAKAQPSGETAQPPARQTFNPKERKAFLVKEMRKRIDLYFDLNVTQIGDAVPKIVSNFLINELLDKLYFNMFRRVADPAILAEMREPDHVVQQRTQLQTTLEVLRNSKKVLLKDPELNAAIADAPSRG